MTLLIWLSLAACLVLSGLFSGSETGFYSLSRPRIDAAARAGNRAARLVRSLQRDEAALLATILIGNNLVLEITTHLAESRVSGWSFVPAGYRELVLALLLTPVVFFFGELLPKDLFRRRPHALVPAAAPLIAVARVLFLPLAVPLRLLSAALERAAGRADQHAAGLRERAAVLELLAEGTRQGTLEPHAERLAHNVLKLKSIRADGVMVPWSQVEVLAAEDPDEVQRAAVARSLYSRLPVLDGAGRALGYVHQIDVLGAGESVPVARSLRPLTSVAADLSVGRALARLRTTGQRAALVGEAGAPLGWLTLKDLVEEISGDLAGW